MSWPTVPISEACLYAVDCPNRTAPTVDYETPYKMLRTTNVRGGFVDTNNLRCVTLETYERWTRRLKPEVGDVILTREAPLGDVGRLTSDEQVFLGQRLFHYRADPTKLDPRFLAYVLQSSQVQGWIKGVGFGATVQHAKVSDFLKIPIPLPPLPIQYRIGEILSAYDDLIENNRRRIALLEDAARQLYKEWFVRFRFPGHEHVKMVDGVPEGWELGKLGDIATTNQKSFSAKNLPETLRYIDIAAVNKGEIAANPLMPSSEAPGRARRIAAHGDVIWSNVRPNLRAYALVLNPDEIDVFSTGFTVLSSSTLPYSYLYLHTTADSFVNYLVNQTTGASYPAVRPDDFERADIVVPAAPLLSAFHDMCEPNFELAALLRQQNRQLAKARDLLLPKLMNGTLTI